VNKVEVAKLLTRASAVDNRVVTEETVAAWHEVLEGVRYDAAVEAVNEHFKTSTEYLMPAHIITGARRVIERWERDARVAAIASGQHARELEASAADRARPIPQCEHGKNLALCMPCCKRLADEASGQTGNSYEN